MPCLVWNEENVVESAIPSCGPNTFLFQVYGESACDRDWVFYYLFVTSFCFAVLVGPLVAFFYLQELQKRKEELRKRNKEIRIRDEELLKRNEVIQTRDAQILKGNQDIGIRDEKIQKCNQDIWIRDEKILKCNREIQMLKEQIETPKCIICLDKDVSMVFSCGHAITCGDCVAPRALRAYGSKCLKCDKPITAVTKLYY